MPIESLFERKQKVISRQSYNTETKPNHLTDKGQPGCIKNEPGNVARLPPALFLCVKAHWWPYSQSSSILLDIFKVLKGLSSAKSCAKGFTGRGSVLARAAKS